MDELSGFTSTIVIPVSPKIAVTARAIWLGKLLGAGGSIGGFHGHSADSVGWPYLTWRILEVVGVVKPMIRSEASVTSAEPIGAWKTLSEKVPPPFMPAMTAAMASSFVA